jgi:hypothetical protein
MTLGEEFGRIFAGLTERMMAAHVKARKRSRTGGKP